MFLIIHTEGVWLVPLIIFYEGYIWTGHRTVIYLILEKSIFLKFIHHGKLSMKYI